MKTTQPNDDQSLKLFLAVRLEEKMFCYGEGIFFWRRSDGQHTRQNAVKDTEWLHIVWLVEQQILQHGMALEYWFAICHFMPTASTPETFCASWQNRAMALSKVLEP